MADTGEVKRHARVVQLLWERKLVLPLAPPSTSLVWRKEIFEKWLTLRMLDYLGADGSAVPSKSFFVLTGSLLLTCWLYTRRNDEQVGKAD